MKIVLYIIMITFILSCRTVEYVPEIVEKVKIEYKDKISKDFIYWRDTVVIERKNDTVYNEVIKWRERIKTDTVEIIKIDSVPVIKEVTRIKEVNRLNFWQKMRLRFLNIIIAGVIIFMVYVLFIRKK